MGTTVTAVKVGDRVRSFDFDGRDIEGEAACYIEGTVESITDPKIHPHFRDCARYAIRVTRRIFAGENRDGEGSNVGECVYPPLNGTQSWLGRTMAGVERF